MARDKAFARVNPSIGAHVGLDELIDAFARGDEEVANTRFDDIELVGDCANEAAFDGVVFRSCIFETVDFSRCTFRDVRFETCRFIRCNMERVWLSRCDFVGCSAPGLDLLGARVATVAFTDCDLSYANLSDAKLERVRAVGTRFREVALQRSKLRNVFFDACDLTRVDAFGTPLAGVDVSTCDFAGPVLSSDFHELRGCVMSPEQALALAGLLGVVLAED